MRRTSKNWIGNRSLAEERAVYDRFASEEKKAADRKHLIWPECTSKMQPATT